MAVASGRAAAAVWLGQEARRRLVLPSERWRASASRGTWLQSRPLITIKQEVLIMKIVGVVTLATLALWTGMAARQVQPYPGPGSGVVTVAGTVNVGNSPSVLAAQHGEWKVAVTNTPEVRLSDTSVLRIASPSFLTVNRPYVITWAEGDRESVTVEEVGNDGWVRVRVRDAKLPRWVNTSRARSVEVAP
jgi:hypothetical protein